MKSPRAHSKGSALLIVLAFLLLLTTLTVAFLSRATFERQLSNASFSLGKVDLAGQGAINAIICDLQQEIVAGSNGGTLTLTGGYLYPNSPTTAVPALVVPGYSPSTIVGTGVENLLKISYPTPFWPSTGYSAAGPQRASSVSTGTASLNYRLITNARWNKPLLMNPVNVATTVTDFTPPSAFTTPDWIYIARDGSNPTSSTWSSSWESLPSVAPTAATGTAAGTNPITQRYAYAIYDEGGTLDLNVAGCPFIQTTTPYYSTNQPYKNALPYADLTQLPYAGPGSATISTLSAAKQQVFVNAIVGWRNFATSLLGNSSIFPNTYSFPAQPSTSSADFDQNVIFNPGGFMTVSGPVSPSFVINGATTTINDGPQTGVKMTGTRNQTDNAFVSRQRLLQFFLLGLGQNSTFTGATGSNLSLANLEQLLPYFGTFSRDLSQPSYAPDPNRPVVLAPASGGNDMGGQVLSGSYTAAEQNTVNPAFLYVTAATTFTRNDGSTAVIGEPLVKKRFALNRLAWLTYLGPVTSTTSPRTNTSLTAPSSTQFTNGNSNFDYDIYLLENTYGIPVSFLAQGTAANIYKYFGLSWVSDSRPTGVSGTGDSQMKWVYNHTSANPVVGTTTSPITSLPAHPASRNATGTAPYTTIYTLAQVAAAGREPDFFELLKAAMTAGSLGKCAHASGTTNTTYQFSKDTSLDAQVIQIGANIIAQFQPSGVPPRILFDDGSWTAQAQEYRGVEDLPYLYSVTGGTTRLQDTNPTFSTAANGPNNGTPSPTSPSTYTLPDNNAGVGAYFMVPSIWNPHALNPNVSGTAATAASTVITAPTNANVAAYAAAMGPRPTQFRIFAIGGTPNMTGPPTTLDPNQVSVLATCRYSGGTGAPGGAYTDPQTYTNGLQTPISLNPPDVSLPDTSLTFSIPLTYTGSVASPTAPTTAWRPDLFREPTMLNKPQVPSGTSLQFGANNIVRTGLFATLFSTQLTNGNGGLENSMGDQDISYTSVGATDLANAAGTKPAYVGIFMGAFPLSWNYSPGAQNYIISAGYATSAQNWGNIYMTYRIQCKDPATGNWETYDEKLSHPTCYGWGTNEYDITAGGAATQSSMVLQNAMTGDQDVSVFADPRTSRFGVFFNDPNPNSLTLNGNWEWPIMWRSRNTASNYYNAWNRTGWAAPTNALTAAINQIYSANAAAQNAMYTFRPDEEGGYAVGFQSQNTTPPTALGWYSVGAGHWQIGNICQNNPASTDITSQNSFGFFSAIDVFGHPGSNSVQFYADADGVVRRAMAGYLQPGTNSNAGENVPAAQRPAGSPSGVPMAWTYSYATTAATIPGQAAPDTTYSNNVSSRPVMLNRPFRTVAELGHVFSDTPWRNLDFTTPESGSSALLDIFCINDTNDPGGLVAGKVDLNTRQAPVLQAVIAGAFQDTFNPTTANIAGAGSTSTATADNIAKALVARTTDTVAADVTAGAGPLRNITELAGKYSGSNVLAAGTTGTTGATGTAVPPWDGGQTYVGFSGAPTTASGTPPSSTPANLSSVLTGDTTSSNYYAAANIQRYRESAIRALSAAGTTRVWNLMIDVIAQTGRFPASASSLANFNVEGERRYWVHVAIDRYTGKVLDEQVEEVKE